MTNLLRSLQRTLRGVLDLHATSEDILAYRDRELGPVGRWWVGTHLRRCEVCRREAELLNEDVQTFRRMDHLFQSGEFLDTAKGLRNLRRAISDWEANRLLNGDTREPVRMLGALGFQQLTTEFELYLGNGTTAAFLGHVPSWESQHRDVLVEAEDLLREFLGRNAAAAATRRILHAQVLMDKSVQGSLPA